MQMKNETMLFEIAILFSALLSAASAFPILFELIGF